MNTIANKTAVVRSRVEPDLKDSATDVLQQCGLSLSDAFRLFLRQVVAIGGLPFDVKVPNALTQAAMQEARALKGANFGSVQELIDDLEKETGKRKARRTATTG